VRIIAAALLTAGILLPAAALARRRTDPPITLLFVSRRCPACRTAAARLDSVVRHRANRAVILADSGDWSRLAPHVRVATDSGHALARLFGVAAEPAVVSVTAVVRYDLER
jgi:hypothetical protein